MVYMAPNMDRILKMVYRLVYRLVYKLVYKLVYELGHRKIGRVEHILLMVEMILCLVFTYDPIWRLRFSFLKTLPL